MLTLFRFGLLPIVLFCGVIVTATIDTYSTTIVRKSSWPETVATVVESQDPNQKLADFHGVPNTFPDPHGTVSYVINGETHTWEGRGRDMGVTVMNPHDTINVYYNPEDPSEINTLVLLGASTGRILFAGALAFIVFYVWFFWLRGWLGRPTPPDDSDGDVAESFAGGASAQLSEEIERQRFAARMATIDAKPSSNASAGPRTTFGKR